MIRTLRFLLLVVLIASGGYSFAQGIYGKVLDEKKQPIGSAIVQAFQGGILKGGAATDYEGNYEIKPLDGGNYFLTVTYLGYDTEKIQGVIVPPNDEAKVNFAMSPHAVDVKLKHEVVIRSFKKPLVGSLDHTITAEEIKSLPTTQVADVAATAPGAYQSKRGGEINMGGARVEGTLYIIDGVQVQYIAGNRSGVDMSQGSVEEIEVETGGISAKYGDVSGGVVNITTRGVTQKMQGGVRLEHSIDGYNNNLVNFNLSGPLLKMVAKDDSTHTKKPVMGFSLSGDYYDDHNRYPNYYPDMTVKGDVLQSMLNNPLRITTDNTGSPKFFLSSMYVTPDQMVANKIPPNNELKELRLNGKLDFQPVESIHVVAGGSVDYVTKDLYSRTDALFAPAAIPTQNNFSGRGFVKLTQKFSKVNDTSHSLISNAFYTVQADFQRESTEQVDKRFGKDFFRYAYVGKFTDNSQQIYIPGAKDSASNRTGVVLLGTQSNGFTFQRATSNYNSDLANYTTQLFNYYDNSPLSRGTILTDNGLMNGDEPGATYSIKGVGMYASPGTTSTLYSIFKSDQYGLTVDASFDLKTGKLKHAIEFGLYYQQRVVRDFAVVPANLWALMRQGYVSTIANNGLKLDKTQPYFIIGGHKYSLADVKAGNVTPLPTDTIVYNYINVGGSTFDANLRKELGLSANQDINVDALDPSKLSLGMFSADQILNSGSQIAAYYGYTYSGGVQTGTVNFNDFWTKKDANGDYSRPIAAFTPNYVAGYIQDKFRYEDLKFNIGVRIDRYSANTKILSDPYSEYPEGTVSTVSGALNPTNGNQHPSNMTGNYVVYVDNNTSSSPTIIGYRNGNNWYDPKGNLVEDPATLKQYSGGRDPQPYIPSQFRNIKISDSNYNPNYSFTDYTPQVNIQPRVNFSFPISEEADFFAHYDIYEQRPYPNSIAISTPATYYFLSENANSIQPNSALRPSKTFDYEVGFQQKLTEHSAMTITGFYKERKDMVTVIPYLYAWPTTYYTYGNRDFSTTKGGTFNFDFRTTNHLRMNLSYTLQFAEGTGSTANSSSGGTSQAGGLLASLIQAGLPNLQYVIPLDYDSRHTFAANIDYRYKEGEGPMIGGQYILGNAGIDFVARARSGEPFTRFTTPDNVNHTLIGGVNGSRLPWHFGLDMRIDKDFKLSFGKKHADDASGVKIKQAKYLRAYVFFQNLLNIQDITGVYGYTGKPNDDGYIASSFGQQYVPQQVSPKSFIALYNLYVNDPGHYNYARTVNFGLEFNF